MLEPLEQVDGGDIHKHEIRKLFFFVRKSAMVAPAIWILHFFRYRLVNTAAAVFFLCW